MKKRFSEWKEEIKHIYEENSITDLIRKFRNLILEKIKEAFSTLDKIQRVFKKGSALKLIYPLRTLLCEVLISAYILNKKIYFPYHLIEELIELASRKCLINALSNLVMDEHIPFPFKNYFMTHIDEKFSRIRNYQPIIDNSKYSPHNINFSITRNFFPFTFNKKYLCIKHQPNEYQEMETLTDFFTVN